MNIHLSAIGWVTDAPHGHRLRWDYPLQALDGERPVSRPAGDV